MLEKITKTKMIVVDLDKTLLHDDFEISGYSLDVLKSCKEKNILVAVATSRSEYSAKKYVDLLQPDIVVTSGGAVARRGDVFLHRALVPCSILNGLIKEGLSNDRVICIRVMGEFHELSNKTGLPAGQKDYGHYDYDDFSSPMAEDAWKIQFETKDVQFLKGLIEKYPSCELVSYNNEDLHKISNCSANKKDAIQAVCDYYAISMQDVMAFGDDSADYELMKAVGCGVAVKNAIDKVLSIADCTCESNEKDGVARFLEHHILKEGV